MRQIGHYHLWITIIYGLKPAQAGASRWRGIGRVGAKRKGLHPSRSGNAVGDSPLSDVAPTGV